MADTKQSSTDNLSGEQTREDRRQRYSHAARSIQDWMDEDSDYDDRVGPVLDEELKQDAARQVSGSEAEMSDESDA